MERKISWTELKSLIDRYSLPCRYLEQNGFYEVWVFLDGREYNTVIYKSEVRNADQIDFEDNGYK